uniref:histidine kinase n=1 Tax=uncultured bacterium CSL132 TaxID=1091568 RepID=G4WVI9_9BACT|nr:putative PEP-CTERM system histidine kinase [uncultured bacterium CSL132]
MAISIGTLSYAAAAAAFLFLFLLLVTSWRGRLQGMLLATASLCNAIWAGAEAYLAARPDTSLFPSDVLEVVRSAVWFAFLMVLLGYSRQKVEPLRRVAAGLAAFCGVVLAVTLYSGAISATRLDMFEMLSRLVLAVIGMVLVEQLYRNVRPQQRWGIKFLCLGLGGMFACDFYLYSDTLLFRHVNDDIWAARGVVNAIIVPLLAVATARNPRWSLDISVSRRILFHSTAMLGAAVYLLGMAAAGYYVRYVGGTWGGVLQVTFLFGAVLLLFVMMFSGTLRARLKVFLSKNFFNYHYDYREEWLRFTRTLSEGEPGIQLRERSIQAIAELVDSPGGILWLSQDTGELEQVAHWNMPAEKTVEQLDGSLCQFLEKRQWVIHLDNYDLQPELYDGLALPEWLRAVPRAWLVVPLILHERLLGFVVLAKSKSNIEPDWEVNDLLKTAGMQAASYLAQLEAATALLVARQFESFNRMSAFVVHDLKNLIAQLSLLLSNADKHKDNPEFQEDMVQTIANSRDKMKRLLLQLRGGYSLEPPAPVAVHEVVRQAVAARSALKPVPRFESSAGALSVVAHSARLERVIGHLIQNAVEATPSDGQVLVQLSRQSGSAVIEISDSGCGMTEQFMRSRLFKPFESTKLTGMGIGTYEARQYVRELGGRIDVQTRESQGTTFRVMLPLELPDSNNAPGYAMEGHA